MSIIYIHGVKVRSPDHGIELEKPFTRWLAPKIAVNGGAIAYEPVYWGDIASDFRWDLASRPKTPLLGMGGTPDFAGLGALREAAGKTPLDVVPAAPAAPAGPVIGGPAVAAAPVVPPLSRIPPADRPDFIADLYLALHPRHKRAEDPMAEDPQVAAVADAAADVAAHWDAIMQIHATDGDRAAELMRQVERRLAGGAATIGMGGFADWMQKAGETLSRAAVWPGDAVSTVFAELRPVLNEFVAFFLGDVLTYLDRREADGVPGDIPKRVLDALARAQARKQATGEKIVIVTHSMGGQLLYDALTWFALRDPRLKNLDVDHWISCGAQVSFFAELGLLRGQPTDMRAPKKLQRPPCVRAWTSFFDRNDFVGFIMAPVFDGVTDQEYNTGYGLAFSHTGYLARPSFFAAMAARL